MLEGIDYLITFIIGAESRNKNWKVIDGINKAAVQDNLFVENLVDSSDDGFTIVTGKKKKTIVLTNISDPKTPVKIKQ